MGKIKILLGGSPCTHWSIAKKGRETTCQGLGWELFLNYVTAKEKFNPDYFLYENVASASREIKAEIAKALGVELMQIDSALVSAQMRKRIYAFNWKCEQPKDRGILLKEVLMSGEALSCSDKCFCIPSSYAKADIKNAVLKRRRDMVAEKRSIGARRVGIFPFGDGRILDSRGTRIYSESAKSVTLSSNGGGMGAKTGLYAINTNIKNAVLKRKREMVAETVILQRNHGFNKGNIYEKKAPTITASGSYADNNLFAKRVSIIPDRNENQKVYEVKNGKLRVHEKEISVKLEDGKYIIRKLYPVECERLQTLPDGYTEGISNTQRYKCLGNGWTAAVIEHILQAGIGHLDRDTPLQVLSLYDGIATGRYVLDIMGFKNVEYHAYEIDKYAMQISVKHYPDIIQHGDAFGVRNDLFGKKGRA